MSAARIGVTVRKSRSRADILLLCLGVATLSSCTSKPGSLTLALAVDKPRVEARDPIRICATLTAANGPVCLGAAHGFQATLDPCDGGQPYATDDQVVVYGLGDAVLLPFYPILLPGALGDVGDSLHRFVVLQPGDSRTYFLTLDLSTGSRDWGPCLFPTELETREWPIWEMRANGGRPPWTPGEYELTLRLLNEYDGIFPPPLFWKPYSRTVAASVRIMLLPPTTATRQVAAGAL